MAQWSRAYARAVLMVLAAAAGGTAAAYAQMPGSRSNERVLFLVPQPADPGDSSYVVQLADQVRQRMQSRMRNKLFVVQTEQVCELLSQSGYQCDTILNTVDAARLARAMQADAYIIGQFERNGAVPAIRYRLVDLRRSGLSGWQRARGAAGDPPRQFADAIVDSLDMQVRAAERARECLERRDRGDFEDALRRARAAFEIYPNHPSAAVCAAVVFEARQMAPDSQIVYYERAVRGDSLNERALERLSRLHLAQGDSVAALEASRRLLELNPTDRDRRRGVIAGYNIIRQYEEARELADEWLEGHPDDLEFLQFKARACTQGEMWRCALDALAAQYERDSTLVGDTIFYGQIVGAAQESDSVQAVLRWSEQAIHHSANPTPWLRAHLGAVQQLNMTDSAAAIYDRLVAQDSSDVTTVLSYAKLLLDNLTIDSVVPLDTARLFKAERLLDAAVTRAPNDTAIRMNAAVQYYTPASTMLQAQKPVEIVVRLLEKAQRNDVLSRLIPNTNFFLGWAFLMQVYRFDEEVMASKSCQMVGREAEMVRRGKQAMTIAEEAFRRQLDSLRTLLASGTLSEAQRAAIDRQRGGALSLHQAALQFLQQYQPMEERIPQLRQAFCQ